MTHRLRQSWGATPVSRETAHVTEQPGSAADAQASRINRLIAAGTPYSRIPNGVQFVEHISGTANEPGFDRTVRLTWEDM